jgi:hypothetical protein
LAGGGDAGVVGAGLMLSSRPLADRMRVARNLLPLENGWPVT